MGSAISEVLPFAIGVAISPAGVIAVILVLFSARARVNGPVFLLGWVVGVAILSTVMIWRKSLAMGWRRAIIRMVCSCSSRSS